jgi:hypothetical protein
VSVSENQINPRGEAIVKEVENLLSAQRPSSSIHVAFGEGGVLVGQSPVSSNNKSHERSSHHSVTLNRYGKSIADEIPLIENAPSIRVF